MKIKQLAAICKKRGTITVYDRPLEFDAVEQWIGDGCAMYPIINLPYLTEESIYTIFDVPEKQQSKYFFRRLDGLDGIRLEDDDPTEIKAEKSSMSITAGGGIATPLRTPRGVIFIEAKYLGPLIDVLDVLDFYIRTTPHGTYYIAVKAGMLLQAVILPYDIIDDDFITRLENLLRQCRITLLEKSRAASASETEQYGFDVDPETGEIISPEDDKEDGA